MSEEVRVPYKLPLDSGRFLRRECPTCEREFKWHIAEEGGVSDEVPEGGYFCPHCAIQAPPTAWFTQAQVQLQQGILEAEVVGPEIEKLMGEMRDVGRNSGGFIKVERGNYRKPGRPDALTETDDMRRVDLPCHPVEPVKVLEDWEGAVHCLICGQPST